MKEIILSNKLTILVNSCDDYEDLWNPFFTLLKKYWQNNDLQIILNTESKDFYFKGLNIKCIHTNSDFYGQRMINCLDKITTPYTLFMLDDFFLRQSINIKQIKKIINYMDNDKHIVSFSCNVNDTYCNWEMDSYKGYRRVPYGNQYTLTMQAGIWRTKKLISYWRPKVSPWEWEEYCNLLTTFRLRDKFYISNNKEYRFCDYGYNGQWMGVYHGKWVIEDVKPLFEREGIIVDLEKRGVYFHNQGLVHMENQKTINENDIIKRCLGIRATIGKFFYKMIYPIIPILYEPFQGDYLSFLKYRAQVRFAKKNHSNVIHVVTVSEFLRRFIRRIFKKGFK